MQQVLCIVILQMSEQQTHFSQSAPSVQTSAVLSISCTVPEVSQATDLTPEYNSKHSSQAETQHHHIF